jgi:hypothetical protein
MKNRAKPIPAEDDRRQAEAAKTSRLRALRLAKEAADKETAAAAAREAAAAAAAAAVNSAKPARRRARAAPRTDQPAPA